MTTTGVVAETPTGRRRATGRTFRPEPSWIWAVVLAALVARLWWSALQHWPDPELLRWAMVDAQAREVALIGGPVVAVVAAIVGQWNHTMALGPAGVRTRWSIVGRQVGVMGGSILAGLAIGMAPLWYMAGAQAVYGGPSPGVYLGGLASLALFMAVGYTIGALWNNRLAVLVAAVVSGLMLLGPIMANGATSAGPNATGFSWLSIAPVWLGDVPPVPGFTTVEATMWSRTAVFVIATGALVLLAIAGTRRLDDLDHPRLPAVASLALPVALAVLLLQRQPFLMTPVAEMECRPAVAGQICTTADSANALASSTEGFDTVMNEFAPPSAKGDVVHTVILPDDVEGAYATGATAAVESFTGAVACMEELERRDYVIAQGDPFEDHMFVDRAISWNVLTRVGQERYEPESTAEGQRTVAEALARMSDDELRQLIDVNSVDLVACELEPSAVSRS